MDRQEAFLGVFLKHQAEIRTFIGSLIRDRHAGEDVFQEVALILWREFEQYDPARSFGAWARGIAAKKIMQRWEKLRRQPVTFAPQAIQAVLDAYERSERSTLPHLDALQQCLEKLPERKRRLLVLRYEDALPLDDIARRVRGTVAAVHKALTRLRQQLQACVERRLAPSAGRM